VRLLGALALALLCLAPLAGASSAEPDRLASAIGSLGYAVKSDWASGPSSWESAQFDLRHKRELAIKATEPLPRDPHTYYRFTVTEECFGDPTAAEARLARLREEPPGLLPEEKKAFPLRRGFRRGETVYVVATDVYLFDQTELPKFAAKLEAALAR